MTTRASPAMSGATTLSFRSGSSDSSGDSRTSCYSDAEQEEEFPIRVTAFLLTKQLKLAPSSECYHPEYLHSFTSNISKRLLKPSELWHKATRSGDHYHDEITLVCESYFDRCMRESSIEEKANDCRVMECCFRNSDDSKTEGDGMNGPQEPNGQSSKLQSIEVPAGDNYDSEMISPQINDHEIVDYTAVEKVQSTLQTSSKTDSERSPKTEAIVSEDRVDCFGLNRTESMESQAYPMPKPAVSPSIEQDLHNQTPNHQAAACQEEPAGLQDDLQRVDMEAPSGIHQTPRLNGKGSHTKTSSQEMEATEPAGNGPETSVKQKNNKKKNKKKTGKKANKDPSAKPIVESTPKVNCAALLKRYLRPKIVFHETFTPLSSRNGICYEKLYNGGTALNNAITMLNLEDAELRVQTEVVAWLENTEQCIAALEDAIGSLHRHHGLKVLEGKESDAIWMETQRILNTLRESGHRYFDGLNKKLVLSDQGKTILRGTITHLSGLTDPCKWLAFEEQFRPSFPIKDCDNSWKEYVHFGKARLLDAHWELQRWPPFSAADDVLLWLASRSHEDSVTAIRRAIKDSKRCPGLKIVEHVMSTDSCEDPQDSRSSPRVASARSSANPRDPAVGYCRDGESDKMDTSLPQCTGKPHDTGLILDDKNGIKSGERHEDSTPSLLHHGEVDITASASQLCSESESNDLMLLAGLSSRQKYVHVGLEDPKSGPFGNLIFGLDNLLQVVPNFEGFVCFKADMDSQQSLLSLGAANGPVNDFMILTSPIIVSQMTASTDILADNRSDTLSQPSTETTTEYEHRENSASPDIILNSEPDQRAPNENLHETATYPTSIDHALQDTVFEDFQLFDEADLGDGDSPLFPPQDRHNGSMSFTERDASSEMAFLFPLSTPTVSLPPQTLPAGPDRSPPRSSAERDASPDIASPSPRIASPSPRMASPSPFNEPTISLSPRTVPVGPNPSPRHSQSTEIPEQADDASTIVTSFPLAPPALQDYGLKNPLPATHYLHHTIILPPLSDERDTQPLPHKTPVIQRRAVPQIYYDPYLGLQKGLLCPKCGVDGYRTPRTKERDWRVAVQNAREGGEEAARPNLWDAIEELGMEEYEGGFEPERPKSVARAVIFVLPVCGGKMGKMSEGRRYREYIDRGTETSIEAEEPATMQVQQQQQQQVESVENPDAGGKGKGRGKGKRKGKRRGKGKRTGKRRGKGKGKANTAMSTDDDEDASSSSSSITPAKALRNIHLSLRLPNTGTFRDDAAEQIAKGELGRGCCRRSAKAILKYWLSVVDGLMDGSGAVRGDWQGGRVGRVVRGFW